MGPAALVLGVFPRPNSLGVPSNEAGLYRVSDNIQLIAGGGNSKSSNQFYCTMVFGVRYLRRRVEVDAGYYPESRGEPIGP